MTNELEDLRTYMESVVVRHIEGVGVGWPGDLFCRRRAEDVCQVA